MSVLIVGAGVSGLSCGYNLDILSAGAINLQILEAQSKVGGRTQNVKEEADFIDFDLDMGGQDLFFNDFTAYENLLSAGEDFPYNSVSWARDDVDYLNCQESNNLRNGFTCRDESLYRSDLGDSSFRGSSLAAFVAEIFLPRVDDNVSLNTVVTEINYTNRNKIVATTNDGRTYEADQLVVAVPISQLKKGAIRFNPPLPSSYTRQIDRSRISEGARIWVQFSEKFYEDVTRVDDLVYWDAARGKSTNKNIITIQGVNEPELTSLSDKQLRDQVLLDLDIAYGGMASETYVDFFVKNWKEEQYIEMTNADRRGDGPEDLDIWGEPVDDRIWFAGDYTRLGSQNVAAESGKFIAGKVYQKYSSNPGLCASYLSPSDLIVGDEVCFSTPNECEATADLNRNGRESCDSWCQRSGLACTGAWDDGAFCEKRGEINCSTTGNRGSICKCEPSSTEPGLCQRFLAPVDRIVGNEVCSDTPDECVATADLVLNDRESCDQWCQREGLRCTRAWDDGDFCEKRGTIPCSRSGNRRSICQCER